MGTSTWALDGVALSTPVAGSLAALLNTVLGGAPYIAQKAVVFNATPVSAVPLFTVTGAVMFRITAICTTLLTPAVAGATLSVGTPAAVAGIIAATTAADIDAGEIWFAAAPATVLDTIANAQLGFVIGDGADIQADVAVQAITSGAITFTVFWQPLTVGATLVAV